MRMEKQMPFSLLFFHQRFFVKMTLGENFEGGQTNSPFSRTSACGKPG